MAAALQRRATARPRPRSARPGRDGTLTTPSEKPSSIWRKSCRSVVTTIIGIVGGIATVVVAVVFLLGRRSGKKKTTYVEIRRV